MGHFYLLTVQKIERITPHAVTISFHVPEDWKGLFQFKAGQYITLKKELKGEEIRRSYSICSAPQSDELTIAVKKTPNGILSGFLNSDVQAGSVLEVHPPEGRFVCIPEKNKNYAAFAAGSGITPVMSMIRTVLEESNGIFVLVYGNRRVADTMFYDEILKLRERYPQRFRVYFVYSNDSEPESLFGRIDKATVKYVLQNKHAGMVFEGFYLCGPEGMMKTVAEGLRDNGVAESRILMEFFTPPDIIPEPVGEGKVQVTVLLDGVERSFIMDRKQRVLEAALEQGIDAPYSCQGGICSSCMARLKEGRVKLMQNQILTDTELEEGFILTCQAHPLTQRIVVDYDDI